MTEEEFSSRLVKLRMQKGVSARDMSLSIGQNPGYIFGIESGRTMPSMSGFFTICDYLEITPKDFFDDETENPGLILEIVDDMKRMNDERLRHVHTIIKDILE